MSRLVRSAATPGYDAYGTVLCEPHDGAAVAWLPVEEHATTPTRHVSAAALRQRRSGGAMADPRVGDRTRGDPVRPTWPDRRSRGRAAGDLVRRDGREPQVELGEAAEQPGGQVVPHPLAGGAVLGLVDA